MIACTRTFDLETSVGVAPDEAIDFLPRLDSHPGLHPYFTRAEIVAEGSDAAGPWTQWTVTETSRIGPFSYPLRFPTRTSRTSGTSMTSVVRPRADADWTSPPARSASPAARASPSRRRLGAAAPARLHDSPGQLRRGRLFERLSDALGTLSP